MTSEELDVRVGPEAESIWREVMAEEIEARKAADAAKRPKLTRLDRIKARLNYLRWRGQDQRWYGTRHVEIAVTPTAWTWWPKYESWDETNLAWLCFRVTWWRT